MDPMVFSDQKMMKDWIFGEFVDPYNITTKWLKVNMKLPGTSHGQF
jgi:hypothetical protein